MPKVELHVHLEGAIRPETVLEMARKNSISLPADDLQGIREWYAFRNFRHFVEVYVQVTKCIKSVEDLEFVIREFVEGQKSQNILHTEATFSASTMARFVGISWPDQEKALLKGIDYAKELGLSLGFIVDIVRGDTLEGATQVAEWATTSEAVLALGLAGIEHRGTEQYQSCFDLAHERGVPVVPHAGETLGPESVWEVLRVCRPKRIGHGVRSIEDPALVESLRSSGIPLEVCPSSNVALGVYPTLDDHPLPRLLDEGLYVTVNSDDPPMFGTSLTEEFQRCAAAFDLNEDILYSLTLNAANAAIVTPERKQSLIHQLRQNFTQSLSAASR
jgi:aminodeoxyfutalosine deaminase